MVTAKQNITEVEFLVCQHYDILPEELHKKKRKRPMPEVRQVIIYICLTLDLCRNADLVIFFERDHTTIMHGKETIQGYIRVDKRFAQKIETLLHESKVVTSYWSYSNFSL